MASTGAIRTPDQRLRIFVSSTLRELADERTHVRAAVERLRLAPVMFELGARPHPPRDLYRSYLAQSDVFIGIYAASYGWVAPDEEISGLEDEYRLAAPDVPKLVYLKEDVDREPRLTELIARIQADDAVSYKAYRTPDELAQLVEADLATLLAERFDASRIAREDAAPAAAPTARIPAAYTRLIGREQEVADVLALLAERGTRLVTLLGPGGIGKSRLAIAIAEQAGALFPDGTVFVSLENVLEPDLLLPTIGHALGIREAGGLALEERLAIALEGRRTLLVLDNFEQLVSAAATLVRLYTIAPDAGLLVTSRAVLRVRGERVYEVPPLATHDAASPDSISRALHSPAVQLLLERSRAVKPDFEITEANAAAIVGICRAVEGLPLAIELAAARMRVLTPASILQRLDRQLPLLVESSRDLPERQRTLRATIEWSTGLLAEPERRMLRDLAVFSSGFTLDSVESFGDERGWEFPVVDALETLVDWSLVGQDDVDGQSVFSLLVTVREYGIELLRDTGEEDVARDAHARVYGDLARLHGRGLGFGQQVDAVLRLNLERGNFRTAVRHLVAAGDTDQAADMAWRLYLYWWVGGFLTEVAVWMQELLSSGTASVSPRTRAIATFYVAWRDLWRTPSAELTRSLLDAERAFLAVGDEFGAAMALATAGLAEVNRPDPDLAGADGWLREGAERFHALGAGWGESLALVVLGRVAMVEGRHTDAADLFRRAVAAAVSGGDTFTATVAMHHLGRMQLFRGLVDDADRTFRDALRGSVTLRHEEGVAYALEGLAAVAAVRDDPDRAGLLAGAATAIRKRVAVYDAEPFVYHVRYLDELGAAGSAERLRAAEARGREYGTFEVAEYALA